MSALRRSWRYGIPDRLVGECARELGGLCEGCEVGHLHTFGACNKNDSKSSNCFAGFYPVERINQLEGRICIIMDSTNFFAVVDLELGSAMSALSMTTLT